MDVESSFDVLRVSSGVSSHEVEEAYGDLLDVWDPERFQGNDRLRKKVEEERRRIELAYATLQAFHFADMEKTVIDEGEEASAGIEADSGGEPAESEQETPVREDTGMQDSSAEDWDSRTLCGDGSCIGVIGGDARCKECGRTFDEARSNDEARLSASASGADEPEETSSPEQGIDLDDLRRKFAGTRYRDLVQYHIGHQALPDLERCIAGAMEQLPAPVLAGLEAAVDEWNEAARDEDFWGTDTGEVFDSMLETARRLFRDHDAPATEEDLFNVFQVFVLTHAAAASEDRGLRRFAGIRKGLFS